MTRDDAELRLFAQLFVDPGRQLGLAEGALLLAAPEYPGLNAAPYLARLDQWARRLSDGRPGRPSLPARLDLLYVELGFSGNRGAYYDPRNSFLNQVIERRTGIPITLGVVVIEVARRAGLGAHGISFPGHFLVGGEGGVVIDPFLGRAVDPPALEALHVQAGGSGAPSPALLRPATSRQIFVRMLQNLRAIYTAEADIPRLRRVLTRLSLLAPSREVADELAALDPDGPRRLTN